MVGGPYPDPVSTRSLRPRPATTHRPIPRLTALRSTALRLTGLRLTALRRVAALLAAAGLALSAPAGCGSEGADTSCGLDNCTVTFQRGVQASVDIFGVQAKLIGAQDDRVTVEVAGERLELTVGQQAVQAGAFSVSLTSVTDSEVVVRIGR